MAGRRTLLPLFTLALFFAAGWVVPTRAQGARPTVAFLAQHYDISANLDSVTQVLTATAKVEFRTLEAQVAELQTQVHALRARIRELEAGAQPEIPASGSRPAS